MREAKVGHPYIAVAREDRASREKSGRAGAAGAGEPASARRVTGLGWTLIGLWVVSVVLLFALGRGALADLGFAGAVLIPLAFVRPPPRPWRQRMRERAGLGPVAAEPRDREGAPRPD